jgi:hypothetical protein
MFRNEWFLSLIQRLYSKINTLTTQYFTYNRHNTFTVHVPSLITVELLVLLFIKSQFTTDTQNVLHLNHCTHGHVWSLTVAPFQRSWGGCEWFDSHKKCVFEVSVNFQLELDMLGFLAVPTYTNVRIEVGRTWGLYLEYCGHRVTWTFSLVLVWGTHTWSLSEHFRYTLCATRRRITQKTVSWNRTQYFNSYFKKVKGLFWAMYHGVFLESGLHSAVVLVRAYN